MICKIFLLLFSLPILFASCNDSEKNRSGTASAIEIKLTQLNLLHTDGSPVDLSQFKGKTVFINFWATWCKPCLREMPSIQRMMEKLNEESIVFLFASDENPEQIEEFKKENPYPFQYVRVENMEALNIMALPATFIFDADGKLVFSDMGAREWDDPSNLDLIQKIVKQK
jgi:thiol-disulfide isomerase/thioredoxin